LNGTPVQTEISVPKFNIHPERMGLIMRQDLYINLFRKALLIRRVEERIIKLYPRDKIQSPVHLSIGQEAVAVGVCHALKAEDWIFGTYRSHALYLAKGGDLNLMFAELFGKVTGVSGGKAGSMHLSSPTVGMMGSSAIVASSIPHAVGAAFAAKHKKTNQLNVAFFGDGALEEGVAHESLNFASLHQLPIIFVCEDNGFAAHSLVQARQSFDRMALLSAYNIPTICVNEGWDFEKIYDAMYDLIKAARQGDGPKYLEIKTMRACEHVGPGEDFDAGYRSREDFERWIVDDPLVCDIKTLSKVEGEVMDAIDSAVTFAEESSWPGPTQLLTDVV